MDNFQTVLLGVYMIGFDDELSSVSRKSLLIAAYERGKLDALVGDDVRSVDYQSGEEILKGLKDGRLH